MLDITRVIRFYNASKSCIPSLRDPWLALLPVLTARRLLTTADGMLFDCICAELGFDWDCRNNTSGSLSPSSPASIILPSSSSSSCFSLITAADAIGLLEPTDWCLLEASFVFVDVVSPRILSWSAVRKMSFRSLREKNDNIIENYVGCNLRYVIRFNHAYKNI